MVSSISIFSHMTAIENVMEGPKTVLKLPKSDCEDPARTTKKVGLLWKSDTTSQLSGGQQQRVAIARALAMEPDLFDEATSALDPELVEEVLETIKQLADEGMTMMVVTHELGSLTQLPTEVRFFTRGLF